MKAAKNRNYWIAFIGCIACTVLTLMGGSTELDKIGWLVMSDINVAMWLFVAWLFDDSGGSVK